MSLGFLVLRFGKFVGCGGCAKALAGVGERGIECGRAEWEKFGEIMFKPSDV